MVKRLRPRHAALLLALPLSALLGCSVDENAETQELNEVPVSLFDPVAASPVVPFPFDAFFSGFSDPTLNVPNPNAASFVTAGNEVDGFSTTSHIFTDLLGFVDFSTTTQGVVVVNTATGMPLTPGLDYVVTDYPAVDDSSATAPAEQVPINQKRSRLLISPLRPLAPETTYAVAITRALRSTSGDPAIPSSLFLVAASDTPVSQQDAPVLSTLTGAQLQTLEVVRSQLIRPVVEGLGAAGLPQSQLVLAWSFTTQSIGKSLGSIQASATAQPIGVQPVPSSPSTILNTGNLGLGLPGIADIYAGQFSLPYYQQAPGAGPAFFAPLSGFWQADPTQPDIQATWLGQVPCGAFATGATLPTGQTATPSASTTTCFPVPVQQSTQTVPVLMTVPNNRPMPAGGWPIVIFQHGIGQNRTNLFPIADSLAAAGFAAVAIDHPLHGIQDTTSPFFVDGGERHFGGDFLDNATNAPGPDGMPDNLALLYLNLGSLLTGRDNLRQSVADLIHLTASVGNIDLNADGTPDINPTNPRYVGHSLGGIVGGTLLGVNTTIGAASLANPGGGIGKLLDGSQQFGPVVSAALASAGFQEGGDTFEAFLRFAQIVIDDADPINYAVAAAANHPVHMIEVIGDTVVPNTVPVGPSDAANNRVTIAGPLGGTEPLYITMGLDVVDNVEPGVTQALLVDVDGVDAVVRLTAGDHGSILDPSASPAATVEIQTEIANFLGSGGTCLPVGQSCPQPQQ